MICKADKIILDEGKDNQELFHIPELSVSDSDSGTIPSIPASLDGIF